MVEVPGKTDRPCYGTYSEEKGEWVPNVRELHSECTSGGKLRPWKITIDEEARECDSNSRLEHINRLPWRESANRDALIPVLDMDLQIIYYLR